MISDCVANAAESEIKCPVAGMLAALQKMVWNWRIEDFGRWQKKRQ